MHRRTFGSTGREVALIGQGTWQIDAGSRAAAVATLRAGLDRGMDHIDTAEMYGDAENVVAEAIEGRRDGLFLVSKVLPQNATRAGTIAACERSLARLGTDRLDCYLLHWPSRHPLEETIAGLEALVQGGKILSWGVSNFDVDALEEALAVAGPGRIACNQLLYHLRQRGIEHEVMPWCERHGVAVVGYTPFGRGGFPGPESEGGRVLADIAEAHGATPRQVALAALARRAFLIPKAGTPDHAVQNAGAGELRLSEEEQARIDAAFPRGPKPSELPTA